MQKNGLCGSISTSPSRTRALHENTQIGQTTWQRINQIRDKTTQKIYGQKNAGRVWNKYLVNKLTKIGFTQSNIDECIFYKGQYMYVLYTYESIVVGPNPQELDDILT